MTTRWPRAFAVVGLLAVSCGPIHGVATSPSSASAVRTAPSVTTYPAPTTASSARTGQCQAVQPAPQFSPSALSNRNLALVTLRGSNQLVVRDITDINHPSSIASVDTSSAPGFASPTSFRFASPTEISYIDPDGNLVRSGFGGSSRVILASCVGMFDWSPDGTSVVYTSPNDSGLTVHELGVGTDRVLGSVPPVPAVGCETIASCSGTDTWDIGLAYSPDGTLIYFVETIANVSVFRLWTSDGTLRKSADSQSPSMAAWSGNGLYFRGVTGVEVWRSGIVSTFLPAAVWIRPKASMGAGQIAYETRDTEGWHHVNVVDTTTGTVRELMKGRTDLVYLTSRYIWYLGERTCGPSEGCDASHSATFSGKSYIYDLQDGTETESIITSVADVWPHPA